YVKAPTLVDFLELAHADSVRATRTTDKIAILSRAGLLSPDIAVSLVEDLPSPHAVIWGATASDDELARHRWQFAVSARPLQQTTYATPGQHPCRIRVSGRSPGRTIRRRVIRRMPFVLTAIPRPAYCCRTRT